LHATPKNLKLMKNITIYLSLFALLIAAPLLSQEVTFTNQSNLLGSVSGNSLEDCVVDVNIDGLDDVVRITSAGLYIDYQQTDGTFNQFYYNTSWQNPPTWSLASGDLNDDGYRDFCFGNEMLLYVMMWI